MVMDSEGQPLLRKAPVDSIQNAASRVARDVAAAQDLGKANCVFEIRVFFDGRGVIGHATDSREIELGASRTKQILGGVVHQHKLTARHFDFSNAKSV